MIKEIADAIALIPKEFATAILSVAGAFLVADLTSRRNNKHAQRMLELKQSYDEKQADVDRQLKMRLDIYIPAVKASSQIPVVLGKYLDPSSSDQDCISALAEVAKELAAANAIAGKNSTESLLALSQKLGELVGKNSIARLGLKMKHAKWSSLNDLTNQHITSGKALTELMKNANLNGESKEYWERINQQWHIHETLLADFTQKRDAANGDLKAAVEAAVNTLAQDIPKLQTLQDEALSNLRLDLGLPEDRAARAAFREKSITGAQSAIAEMVAAMKAPAG